MSDAPGWLFSVDWHDKLMGFHNSTFPVGIYGCMGTFSRYMDFISVWDSNPPTIGLRYIQHLFETKRLTFNIRMDCGTETGKLAAIHAFLCDNRDDVMIQLILLSMAPAITNKIERWRDLHDRMEAYFKQQLSELLQTGSYDPNSVTNRRILAYIFIRVV